jgi:hypothetical protein
MPSKHRVPFSTTSVNYALHNDSYGRCVGCEYNSDGYCLKESRWAHSSRCRGELNEAKQSEKR